MLPHKLALEPLTFAGLPAREILSLAHQAGYEYASLALIDTRTLDYDALVSDAGLRRETAQWLREVSLGIQTIEVLNLRPDTDVAVFAPVIEAAQELGARTATVILWENPDLDDALAKFRTVCDMARGTGIRINLEFFASCQSMTTLPRALDFLRRVERPEAGVVIDVLHVMRTAGSIDILKTLDRSLVGSSQLCDGPRQYPGDLLEEAGKERLPPGRGVFPLREFVEWLPRDIVLGVEVPQASRAGSISNLERAKELREAALAVYG